MKRLSVMYELFRNCSDVKQMRKDAMKIGSMRLCRKHTYTEKEVHTSLVIFKTFLIYTKPDIIILQISM